MKEKIRKLPIKQLNLDFQPDENLIPEKVQEYVNKLKTGETLPRIRVRWDGKAYRVEDGFHRVKAATIMKLRTIEAEIVPGTKEDMEQDFQKFLQAIKEENRRFARGLNGREQ